MKTFRNASKFVVTTNAGRKIADGCSIEHVEFIAERGRNRDVWVDTGNGQYRHYRSYSGRAA